MSTTTPETPSIMIGPVMHSTDRPGATCAEFRVGLHSLPYLADHGFQDMVVLPGSFYIEMARRVDHRLARRVPGVVRNVIFRRPIILGAEDIDMRVEARDHDGGRVEYTFYEAEVDRGSTGIPERQYAARLEIERKPPSFAAAAGTDAFSIEAFRAQSHAAIDAERFYRMLRENGNHYGPAFQRISSVWRMGGQSLGLLSGARQHGETEPAGLHPTVLDSVTQLLGSFFIEDGRTFVLQSIEKAELSDGNLPDTLWAHATLVQDGDGDRKNFVGSVRAFDDSGRRYLELAGVAFTCLDRPDTAGKTAATRLVIASNFTVEPIEDALNFWGAHFSAPLHLEFAPFDQIFQQLLDGESALRRNRDGVNVILLALEEWAAADRHAGMTLTRERADQCFGGRSRHVLPNGLEIAHLNHYETDYLYREIFEDQCYLRHGIRLHDGATVLDIGANIGLFSLFVTSRCKDPKIYAFEPAPAAYDLLRVNCEAYGANVRAANVGVSDRSKSATLTFYEKSSVFSGFYADETRDREAIQAVVRNTLNSETSVDGESVEQYVAELTADRLRRTTHECRMTSVSEIIRENRIDRIDLLKIDAEKSELDIINGIDERDWPKIAQIAMEIHDPAGEAVKRIEGLLAAKGYRCAVERERLLEHSGLFNLYATRNGAAVDTGLGHAGLGQARRAAGGLQRNVRDFCTALAAFMKQATAPLILCVCPTTPSVDADADLKAALSDAERILLAEAGALPNVRAIGSALPLQRYPVRDYYDPHSHRLGRIPYSTECYAAIGTALFRTLFSLRRKPFKVIVLDCDNTLWKGVCGEDGALGVEVSAAYRKLQEFMIGQMNAGMLLCLCSKNNEDDVLEVFDQRSDMVLKREHLVSWRINWNSKSDNVKSLAAELGLGLDSFIFIDDNPVDCADVRINCPGVLALQLPRDSESFPAFLDHVWAFDHSDATEEDRKRTRMYQENAQRQRFREKNCSLKAFIEELELRIDIAEAAEDQLGRVSQLTFRTNQFNFTTVRRSEKEIGDFLKREHTTGLAVCVADRFGDYGLVGVVLYETRADRYRVDTFLLSCRVLGKGVEHAILSQLGQRALRENKRYVELAYRRTEKNAPVREFIKSIGEQDLDETAGSWIVAAERAAGVEYAPDEAARGGGGEAPAAAEPDTRPHVSRFGAAALSERLQTLAERLCTIEGLTRAIEEWRLEKELPGAGQDVVSGTALETALLNIWRTILGRPRIGLNDNFFEAGGTSLRAVQLIATIKKELKQTLSIVSLFECPTVRLLAAKLGAASADAHAGTETAVAALRGQRRRNNAMRQHAS
ncbi:MAG: FkbM family methyltransferase [Betaproteobacteria bacterium]|nr:FkbM family methyltransferase [Betaproteobacteria bacterium]